MKIAVIGAGGVGGYFGAKLVQAGHDVTFIARGEHLKAIKSRGLIVKSIDGDFEVEHIKTSDKISDIDNPDLVIVAVKAWQIKELREEIKKVLKDETLILPLQNGVLAADELAETIDKKHILGGLCRIISKIEAPGVIRHIGVNPTIVFGELDKAKTGRVNKIHELFKSAGIESKISEDIEADLWRKFISICVSGLLAISNTTYGELREIKETRQLMIDLIKEIFALSQKIGVNLEADFIEKTLSFIDTFPYDSTASLTRDVWEKRPSEIEYQNGAVVRLGDRKSTRLNSSHL